jgi:hypothetical protein
MRVHVNNIDIFETYGLALGIGAQNDEQLANKEFNKMSEDDIITIFQRLTNNGGAYARRYVCSYSRFAIKCFRFSLSFKPVGAGQNSEDIQDPENTFLRIYQIMKFDDNNIKDFRLEFDNCSQEQKNKLIGTIIQNMSVYSYKRPIVHLDYLLENGGQIPVLINNKQVFNLINGKNLLPKLIKYLQKQHFEYNYFASFIVRQVRNCSPTLKNDFFKLLKKHYTWTDKDTNELFKDTFDSPTKPLIETMIKNEIFDINKEFVLKLIKLSMCIDYKYLKKFKIPIDDDIVNACTKYTILPKKYEENRINKATLDDLKKLCKCSGNTIPQAKRIVNSGIDPTGECIDIAIIHKNTKLITYFIETRKVKITNDQLVKFAETFKYKKIMPILKFLELK